MGFLSDLLKKNDFECPVCETPLSQDQINRANAAPESVPWVFTPDASGKIDNSTAVTCGNCGDWAGQSLTKIENGEIVEL